MEKTFDLNPKEMQSLSTLENDNLRANATYGVLARQMDDCKQKIAQSEEAQRQFIRTVIQNRGIEQWVDARLQQGGKILCILPDEQLAQPLSEVPPPAPLKERPNAKPREEAAKS